MASAYSSLSLPLDDSGDGKVINRYFDNLNDAVPVEAAAPFVADDAVHTLPIDATIDGGNYTLTVTLRNGETFTTGNIAWNANAATIEGAIDTAATAASITGWTNGDISVSGGDIATAPVVLTFDGDSVSGTNHPVTVANDVDIATGTLGTIVETTAGHPACPTLQIVAQQGFLNIPDVTDPTGWTWNTLVPKPERSVWEFVARAAVVETQEPSAYAKVIDLGGFTKPVQARSNIVV